jgi:hypothetical protein
MKSIPFSHPTIRQERMNVESSKSSGEQQKQSTLAFLSVLNFGSLSFSSSCFCFPRLTFTYKRSYCLVYFQFHPQCVWVKNKESAISSSNCLSALLLRSFQFVFLSHRQRVNSKELASISRERTGNPWLILTTRTRPHSSQLLFRQQIKNMHNTPFVTIITHWLNFFLLPLFLLPTRCLRSFMPVSPEFNQWSTSVCTSLYHETKYCLTSAFLY